LKLSFPAYQGFTTTSNQFKPTQTISNDFKRSQTISNDYKLLFTVRRPSGVVRFGKKPGRSLLTFGKIKICNHEFIPNSIPTPFLQETGADAVRPFDARFFRHVVERLDAAGR
jgi:hypothetical protein